jgi:hypothetical protein
MKTFSHSLSPEDKNRRARKSKELDLLFVAEIITSAMSSHRSRLLLPRLSRDPSFVGVVRTSSLLKTGGSSDGGEET